MNPYLPPEEQREELRKMASGPSSPIKFNGPQTAQRLAAERPVAKAYGDLWVYSAGVYSPGGKEAIRKALISALGDDWKRSRADEVIQYLYDSAPELLTKLPDDQINFRNGILDLADMSLGQHTSDFKTPVQIPVNWDAGADCPQTKKFLSEVLDPDAVEPWLEMVGYFLVPDNRLQKAFMARGGGSNGKSTAIQQIQALLGPENVSNVSLQRLEEDRFAPAQLAGKLLNTFADLDHRALQSSSVFKSITGGDSIMGERKYGDAFSMVPYSRLLFSANQPPATSDSSEAFFRRWRIFEFNQRFEGGKVDRDLIGKLTTDRELSGLVNEGIRRLPALLKRGQFTSSESSRQAANRFRTDTDTVSGFLSEACRLDRDARTGKPQLFREYKLWCVESNRRPLGKQNFNRRLQELHPEVSVCVVTGTEMWSGIQLGLEVR